LPTASINFVTSRAGLTLNDLVSHNDKHNEAKGPGNQDGQAALVPSQSIVAFRYGDLTNRDKTPSGDYNQPLMVIGACQLRLHLPGCTSLKGKRGLIRPLIARLYREFNVAAAEVEHQDVWQSADIAIVAVANDAGHIQAELQQIVRWIENNRPEMEVVDAQFELR
jgi:uncharacterized protein YlxP (DUF503 family)